MTTNSAGASIELDRLRLENEQLRTRLTLKNEYIRSKVNQLLGVMGTKPLRPEELDDDMLLEMDPLGIIFSSIRHVLANLKETNARLHLLNDETAAIFEAADVAIMVLDSNYRIQSLNSRMKELFSQYREEVDIKGEYCFHLLCQESSPPELCVCKNVLAAKSVSRIMGKQLHGHVFNVSATPIPDSDGMVTAIVVVYNDITELLQAQEELNKANAELEWRVHERTSQLQAANNELNSFAYSVSHDLRAPLRGIDGFSGALLEEYANRLDDAGKDYINRIRKGCIRMGKLIDDLLKLSRITRTELNRTTVDLGRIAARILEDLQQSDPGREVEISIDSGMIATADLTLIRTVLENLLGNAWKFTRKAVKPCIHFSMTGKGGMRTYCIRDNGAGFDMAYKDKLFAAFQRLHRVDEFEGTGIGLASVQRVILMHGGKVWAEGEKDKGACFYFTLGGSES